MQWRRIEGMEIKPHAFLTSTLYRWVVRFMLRPFNPQKGCRPVWTW